MNASPIEPEPLNLGPEARCHLCGAAGLLEFLAFHSFRRITSDCRPWPAGGRLCVCPACGGVQKIVDDAWNREVARLYAGYAIYDQAEGAEQVVFDQESGAAASRSQRLLTALTRAVALPKSGRALDVGCGNGAMLRAFSRQLPGWSLAGTELGDKYRRIVEAIPGVESLYTCPPWDVPGAFDVVSMVHVLEHIPEPVAFLQRLLSKLVPGGLLVIELPHHVANPFELLIADHCSHFSAATGADALARGGFEVLAAAEDWVPKELTLVARRADNVLISLREMSSISRSEMSAVDCVRERIQWLRAIADQARAMAAHRPIGLFGTSIAGTWVFAELAGAVGFFVDEDTSRVGKTWQGRPVYPPRDIPTDSQLLIPLPPALAASIARRIARPDLTIQLPP